jgi:hypothetical protein
MKTRVDRANNISSESTGDNSNSRIKEKGDNMNAGYIIDNFGSERNDEAALIE